MVAQTVTTTPTPQATPAEIAAASTAVLMLALAAHGEAALIAGLAYAIGVRRILEAAANAKPAVFCEEIAARPSRADARRLPRLGGGGAGDDGRLLFRRLRRREKSASAFTTRFFRGGYTCQVVAGKRLGGLDEGSYGGWAANQTTFDAQQPIDGWSDWSFARHEPCDTAHLILPEGVFIEDGLWHVSSRRRRPAGARSHRDGRHDAAPAGVLGDVGRGQGALPAARAGSEEFVRLARYAKTGPCVRSRAVRLQPASQRALVRRHPRRRARSRSRRHRRPLTLNPPPRRQDRRGFPQYCGRRRPARPRAHLATHETVTSDDALEAVAKQLEATGNFRVLRRAPAFPRCRRT